MLSTLSPTSHNLTSGSAPAGVSDAVAAQQSLRSAISQLTSGQHDVDVSRLTPYASLPKRIEGPTVWTAEEFRKEENAHRWVRHWTNEEIEQLETAAKLWQASGRPLGEIEKATFPLPASLVKTLEGFKDLIVNGTGFFLLKGTPTDRWGVELTAIAYLGLGSYLGNVVSQNGKGHVLGHVKDLGNDPTKIDKVRIYSTNARQYFHTDSSGGIVGLICLHKAVEGGESDVVSAQHLWNVLQEERPDVAETLATPNWYFDRKGETSEGQNGWYLRAPFSLPKGQPADKLLIDWDPYYVRSLGRFVEQGLVPDLSDKQWEALKVLEDTAQRLALHMILDVGDIQLLSDFHILHARTEYKDHPPPKPRRHLLRLWLSTPVSEGGRPTPYEDLDHPRRGGIQVNNQIPTCPLDGE